MCKNKWKCIDLVEIWFYFYQDSGFWGDMSTFVASLAYVHNNLRELNAWCKNIKTKIWIKYKRLEYKLPKTKGNSFLEIENSLDQINIQWLLEALPDDLRIFMIDDD